MHDFPAVLNTKTDIYHLLDTHPTEVRAYLRKLLDERKAWVDGVYQDDPHSTFFRLGFTAAEGFELVPGYVDPPLPAAPPSQAEVEAIELAAWRDALSCGPLQLRRALRAMELMPIIKAYIETAPEEVVEAWEYASEFRRMDPFILAVQAELSRSDAEVDDLFRLALTF